MLTKILDENAVHRFSRYLEKGEKFVLTAHLSPDGDAIGSALGMAHYLLEQGKERVQVIVPNDFPAFLKWMPGAEDVLIYNKYPDYAEQLIREADVIINLDFNEPKRIGDLAPLVEAASGRKVMIDHHLYPAPDFCRLVISHPELSSTCELVFRLLCAMKAYDDISRNAAECLYTGMMTDTGAFSYNSNRADIYVIIGELIKKGIDKDAIYRQVYQVYSESRMRLMGYTMNEKMKVYPAQQAALITLTSDELRRYHYKTGDTEGFVNMPLDIDGIVFSVFIREDPDYAKVSLRSVGSFPCNRFAMRYFNGGGHKNASGGEFYGTLEEAIRTFEQGLAEFNPTHFTETAEEAQAV